MSRRMQAAASRWKSWISVQKNKKSLPGREVSTHTLAFLKPPGLMIIKCHFYNIYHGKATPHIFSYQKKKKPISLLWCTGDPLRCVSVPKMYLYSYTSQPPSMENLGAAVSQALVSSKAYRHMEAVFEVLSYVPCPVTTRYQ